MGGNLDNNNKNDQNEINLDLDATNSIDSAPGIENTNNNEVLIMNTKNEDRPTSFFAQPGILAGLLCLFKKENLIKL